MLIALHLVAGLVALYFGAEWLVRGSASFARRLGISPLLVGLTVVAYGTSAPELIVSLVAAVRGQGALALGNAVGSNIFNVAFILGLTAVITPIRIQHQLARQDTPVMVLAAGAFLFLFRDARIDRGESLILVLVLVAYTALHIRMARKQSHLPNSPRFEKVLPTGSTSPTRDLLLAVAGLATLSGGSHLFVEGAVRLATLLGVSQAVIGLTVVAAGTGLPELAASLMAAWRREPDLAIGNIIGSNIYNMLGIVGIAGSVAGPLDGAGLDQLEVYIMTAVSLLLLPMAWTGLLLRRWEGVGLLLVYAAYLAHLWPR